jgi:hypothetical protein
MEDAANLAASLELQVAELKAKEKRDSKRKKSKTSGALHRRKNIKKVRDFSDASLLAHQIEQERLKGLEVCRHRPRRLLVPVGGRREGEEGSGVPADLPRLWCTRRAHAVDCWTQMAQQLSGDEEEGEETPSYALPDAEIFNELVSESESRSSAPPFAEGLDPSPKRAHSRFGASGHAAWGCQAGVGGGVVRGAE